MDPIERRADERVHVVLPATIEDSGRGLALNAVVHDLSKSGARLEVADRTLAPGNFDLTIVHESGEIETRHAQVVWQADGVVGVHFGDYIGS